MELIELAEKYIEQHDSTGEWSPFDRTEKRAIRMFASWAAAQQSAPKEKPQLTEKGTHENQIHS